MQLQRFRTTFTYGCKVETYPTHISLPQYHRRDINSGTMHTPYPVSSPCWPRCTPKILKGPELLVPRGSQNSTRGSERRTGWQGGPLLLRMTVLLWVVGCLL